MYSSSGSGPGPGPGGSVAVAPNGSSILKGNMSMTTFNSNSLSTKVSNRLIDLASKGDVRGVCSLVTSHRVNLDGQLDCEEWNALQFFCAEGKFKVFSQLTKSIYTYTSTSISS